MDKRWGHRWRGATRSGLAFLLALSWLAGCSGPETGEPAAPTATLALEIQSTVMASTPTQPAPSTASPSTVVPTPAGEAASCATGVDLLRYTDALDKVTYDGEVVGGLSALAWTGSGTTYYALSDRGGRVYTLEFPLSGDPVITGAFWLRGDTGDADPGLDTEGLAILPNGDLLVTSEVEPSIRQYTAGGEYIADLPVPERFLVEPAGGGVGNATFESLSLSPSGQRLFTAVEEPLIGDADTDERQGRIRILRYDLVDGAFQPAAEFLYVTEPDQAVSEVLAVSDDVLLVLERGLSLLTGFSARVFVVPLSGAEDVSNIDRLADTPAAAVEKTLLLDVSDCPAEGEIVPDINPLLDNFESMTFGPQQQDGRRTLLIGSDDNFQSFQITRILVLAVDEDRF